MSSEKPDQIQASVAAALSRLRGDLGPTGATAPKIEEQQEGERTRPANDVRADPFFRSIQSPPPGTGMTAAGRAPIPMTPFPRMQAPQEPAAPEPAIPGPDPTNPSTDEGTSEPASTIEIPDMPEPTAAPEPVSMPEPVAAAAEPVQPAAPAAAAEPPAPEIKSPLSRVMRGAAGPAQRDLLADLPPPPISEPLTTDAEPAAMRRRRRNRRLAALAAVIIVAGLGAWLWTGGTSDTEVPVVVAEATPEKVKPAEEGGLKVQNTDVQVLDPAARTQGETVMPEPEQPITPPAATTPTETASGEQAPTVVDGGQAGSEPIAEAPTADTPLAPGVPLIDTPLPALEENGAPSAPASAQPTTTETAAPEPAPAAPVVAAPEPTQSAEAPTADEPAPAQSVQEPAPAAPTQAAQSEAPAEAPAAQTAPTQEAAVAPTAPAPAAPTGNTRVQLAAGKSEASVQKEWAALQKAHPQLLGDLSLTIERVDKGAAGIFYRLQAGPLADKAAAQRLCGSLKQRGQDCLVVAK